MTTAPVDQELVGQFVTAAHGQEEQVRALLSSHPELLNERYAQVRRDRVGGSRAYGPPRTLPSCSSTPARR